MEKAWGMDKSRRVMKNEFELVSFAQSVEGQAYYQAALAAMREGLAVGRSTDSLAPAPQGI